MIHYKVRRTPQGAIYIDAIPNNDFERMAMSYYDALGGVLVVLPELCRNRGITLSLKQNTFINEFQCTISDASIPYNKRILLSIYSGTSCSAIYTATYIYAALSAGSFDVMLEIAEGGTNELESDEHPF